MIGRLQERGGLPALVIGGLLNRATAMSGGRFFLQDQGDFIGPYSPSPVWGSSLGSLGPDTSLRLARTLGPPYTRSYALSPFAYPAWTTTYCFALYGAWIIAPGRTSRRDIRTDDGPGWTSRPCTLNWPSKKHHASGSILASVPGRRGLGLGGIYYTLNGGNLLPNDGPSRLRALLALTS